MNRYLEKHFYIFEI